MNIETWKEGSKVKFTGEGGYPGDQIAAKKHLTVGKIYTVSHVHIADWSSEVFLKEIDERGFNTVQFEDIE